MEDNAMKKTYMKPAMQVVKIQQHGIICESRWDEGPGALD
jgi:hypothetical protein